MRCNNSRAPSMSCTDSRTTATRLSVIPPMALTTARVGVTAVSSAPFPMHSRSSNRPTVRYMSAVSSNAPPNLCTCHRRMAMCFVMIYGRFIFFATENLSVFRETHTQVKSESIASWNEWLTYRDPARTSRQTPSAPPPMNHTNYCCCRPECLDRPCTRTPPGSRSNRSTRCTLTRTRC